MIYFAEAIGIGHIKIGFTDKDDAADRVAQWQTGCPVPVRLLGVVPGDRNEESDLHRRFAAFRAAGEWFRPVPELLALIPACKLPRCDSVEVVERSVQIKVLTVGRKQFTRALLSQLPERQLLCWHKIMELEARNPRADVVERFNLRDYLGSLDVWGWVATDKCWWDADAATETRSGRWMIFQEGGRLCKSVDYYILEPSDIGTRFQYTDPFGGTNRQQSVEPFWPFAVLIYEKRLQHPGWTQLYIGA